MGAADRAEIRRSWGKLYIKKRSFTDWLMWLLILLPFLFGTLNGLLHLPWAIRYLLDVAWLILLFFYFWASPPRRAKGIQGLELWIAAFLGYTLLVYLVQFQSPFYYLWGIRNNFRFYAAFFVFAAFLRPRDVDDYLALFDKLFWANVVVSLFQYFVLGLEQDYLGGLFGTEKGGNGYTNIFFVIAVSKSLLFYLEKRESTKSCVAKCVAALLVAALAELKFFFVEFVLIIAFAVLFTNFTWRKFWVIVGGLTAVLVGAALLAVVFPSYAGWFSVDWLLEAATADKGYTSSGDLNRLNAIGQINELWLTSWGERLFGLGLGNCDTSSFALVNTPFYEAYGDWHYTWLSHAFMYLENGYFGLIFYFGFFTLVYCATCRIQKHCTGVARTYCLFGRIVAIFCMIISIYNSSFRTEAAYMAHFVLAIPFAYAKDRSKIPDRTI